MAKQSFASNAAALIEATLHAPRLAMFIETALDALLSTPLRTALTSSGIIIGVASVILIMAIGEGTQQDMTRAVNAMGANTLIMTQKPHSTSLSLGPKRQLTERDSKAIQDTIKGVELISPQIRRTAIASGQKGSTRTTIFGITPAYQKATDATASRGRLLDHHDLSTASLNAVIGESVARKVFGDTPALGQNIRINQNVLKVVGVLKKRGQSLFGDADNAVLIPLSTARQRMGARLEGFPNAVDVIQIKFHTASDLHDASTSIPQLMRKRHRIEMQDDLPFSFISTEEFAKQSAGLVRGLQFALASIAAISLLVGSVGLANILLVSVSERTREIGLRMAIGANANDIKGQFIVEALLISLSGGFIGVGLGALSSMGLSALLGWSTVLNFKLISVALILSIFVGLSAGTYPARRASRLSPMAALRSE